MHRITRLALQNPPSLARCLIGTPSLSSLVMHYRRFGNPPPTQQSENDGITATTPCTPTTPISPAVLTPSQRTAINEIANDDVEKTNDSNEKGESRMFWVIFICDKMVVVLF